MKEKKMNSRIIRKQELFSKVGMSDVQIWRWEKKGLFPKRISLGGRSVGWLESEIDAWLEKRAAERG